MVWERRTVGSALTDALDFGSISDAKETEGPTMNQIGTVKNLSQHLWDHAMMALVSCADDLQRGALIVEDQSAAWASLLARSRVHVRKASTS